MRQPLWQRLRRARRTDEEPDEPEDPTNPGQRAPEVEAPGPEGQADAGAPPPRTRDPREIRARLREHRDAPDSRAPTGDVDPSGNGEVGPGDDRREVYAAWAERMRNHKREKLAGLGPERIEDPEVEGTGSGRSAYWDSDDVLGAGDGGASIGPTGMSNIELLNVLGLDEAAGAEDIKRAFKRKAREHHPDRWLDADPEVRHDHQQEMARVNEAYHELQRRGR